MPRFVAPPTLAKFMLDDSFVRCVVGPIGSGKSSACVVEVLRRALSQRPSPKGVRRSRWAIIRNTRPQLQDTTRKTFEQWAPTGWGEWLERDFTWNMKGKNLPDGTSVDCEIMFRALDRPEDVKKVLSLELTGAYINEAREIPKEILDGLTGRVGRFPPKSEEGCSWRGVILDTNPWHTGHWGYKLFSVEKPEDFSLYEQPGGRSPDAENLENLDDGYYQRACLGKDAEWIAEYVDAKYPDSDRGSVYGALLAALKARGGLQAFDHPSDGVLTTWDLGISDSTAIWWWRVGADGGVDVIDHYEAHGVPMSHFFAVVDAKPYQYLRHWMPHDARARELGTGRSVVELCLDRWPGKVSVTANLSLVDGMAAARYLLEQPTTRFHPRCSLGLEALRSYRYEFNEATKAYGKHPVHDWTSHTSDAWRYVSVVAKHVYGLLRGAEAKRPTTAIQPAPLTLDALFEDAERRTGRDRIA